MRNCETLTIFTYGSLFMGVTKTVGHCLYGKGRYEILWGTVYMGRGGMRDCGALFIWEEVYERILDIVHMGRRGIHERFWDIVIWEAELWYERLLDAFYMRTGMRDLGTLLIWEGEV